MNIEFRVEGLEQVAAGLQSRAQEMFQRLVQAMYGEGVGVLAVSQDRVPVRTGALKGSGGVDLPVVEGTKVKVVVGYGSDAVDYALIVENDLEAHHENGQAKFLESSLLEAETGMAQRIAGYVAGGGG